MLRFVWGWWFIMWCGDGTLTFECTRRGIAIVVSQTSKFCLPFAFLELNYIKTQFPGKIFYIGITKCVCSKVIHRTKTFRNRHTSNADDDCGSTKVFG